MQRARTYQTNPGDLRELPTFKPIFGKVVIRVMDESERRTKSGLVLPQRSKERATIGTIFAVYEGEETPDGRVEPQVNVGDTVMFGAYTGSTFDIDAETFIICKEHDLLTVVEFAGDKTPNIEENF